MRPSLAVPFALLALLLVVGVEAKGEVIITSAKWALSVSPFGQYPNQPQVDDFKQSFGTRTSISSSDYLSGQTSAPTCFADATAQSNGNVFSVASNLYSSDPYASGSSSSQWDITFTVIGKAYFNFTNNGPTGGANFGFLGNSPLHPDLGHHDDAEYFSMSEGSYRVILRSFTLGAYGYPASATGNITFSAVPEVGTLLSCSAGLLVLLGLHPRCRSFVKRRVNRKPNMAS